MKILFDFLSLQDKYVNGGYEHVKKILLGLLKKKIDIIGVCNISNYFNDEINDIILKNNIKLVNCDEETINLAIANNNIKCMYIGISQRFCHIKLNSINCTVISMCHDVGDLSLNNSQFLFRDDIKKFYKRKGKSSIKQIIKKILGVFIKKYRGSYNVCKKYNNIIKSANSENVHLCTVSYYSKTAIEFFFGKPFNDVEVFYAPSKHIESQKVIKSQLVKQIIKSKDKYFLLISADRENKNAKLFVDVWEKFNMLYGNQFKAVVVGKVPSNLLNMIVIEKIDSSDLEHLYEHAFCLVYTTVSEGFGYPPLEAAHYNIPTICSYATSLPELYNNCTVMFNPFYVEDLYKAMIEMVENRSKYIERMMKEIPEIQKKQQQDYKRLIDFIISKV